MVLVSACIRTLNTFTMQIPGLIVMQLVSSERQGVSDVVSDPEYSQVWVLFNAQPTKVEFKLPEGRRLHYSPH